MFSLAAGIFVDVHGMHWRYDLGGGAKTKIVFSEGMVPRMLPRHVKKIYSNPGKRL